MNISKCICVEGSSAISFDDAIKYALFEVSKTIDNIYKISIINMNCNINENKISEYIVKLNVEFNIDIERVKK